MNDTIYREDAIKAVCKGCIEEFKVCAHHWNCPKLNNINKVPAVQVPEWTIRYDPCPVCGARIKEIDND